MAHIIERTIHTIAAIGYWGYPVIFAVGFFERAAFIGSLVPGGAIVILVGFMVARGYLSLLTCVAVVAFGAVSGDSVNYFMGKLLGEKYFEHHERFLFLKKKHIGQADEYFKDEGGKTIFLGRFVSFLQSAVSLSAGMSGYSFKRFLVYDLLGNVTWSLGYLLLGYFFGWSWKSVEKWPERLGVVVGALMLIYLLVYFYKRRGRRKRKQAPASDQGNVAPARETNKSG